MTGGCVSLESIKTVAVLGAGTMGNGIAHVFARAGYNVILRDVQESFLQRGMETIGKNLDREVKKGKLTEAEKPQVLARLKPVTDFAAVGAAGFLGEAGAGELEIKRGGVAEAGKTLRAGGVFSSNTSLVSITTPAAMTQRPGRAL